MTRRRWIIFAALLWLAAVVIIGWRTVSDLTSSGASSLSYFDAPLASIDGEPAYTIKSALQSKASNGRGEHAWDYRGYYMIPAKDRPTDLSDRGSFWEAIAIDPPFHVMFRKPDGTTTGPHRVDFTEVGYAEWAADGMSWQFHSGHTPYLHQPFRPEGRVWNIAATRAYLLERLVHVLLWGAIIASGCWMSSAVYTAWRRRPAHQCQVCGYDLRGSAEPGCPECGDGRRP